MRKKDERKKDEYDFIGKNSHIRHNNDASEKTEKQNASAQSHVETYFEYFFIFFGNSHVSGALS